MPSSSLVFLMETRAPAVVAVVVTTGPAPTLGATPENLVAEGGRIFVKGNSAKGVSWKDAC